MTSIRSTPGAAPDYPQQTNTEFSDIPVTDAAELAARSILDNQRETERSARQSQRAAQQLQQQESAARVAAMHDAADQKMIAGLVGAGSQLASSAGTALGGGWESAGKMASAGGQGVASWFTAQAEHASADAAAHEQLASRAGDSARESGDAARSAEQVADRNLQQLGQVLEAKRRAEEAATRA